MFVILFLAAGILLSAILRYAVSQVVGQRVSLPNRLAGAMPSAVRVALLPVVLVLVFDRIIPAGRDRRFLADSRLRPILSVAGARACASCRLKSST